MSEHSMSNVVHEQLYAKIARQTQERTCDIRDCDIRQPVRKSRMPKIQTSQPAARAILERLDRAGLTQRDLADALGLEENKISKIRRGTRRMQVEEVETAEKWLAEKERAGVLARGDDAAEAQSDVRSYVHVEVLPTYAGMGGGGTGEGEVELALVPRALVEDVFRGKASDFLLIDVRGDSMEPDFHHGDQLLVDKRDKSPAQPGPFALWDGDWGEYVVKNVQRSRNGEVRIFSTNPKYPGESAPSEQTRIIGRPVWFGRRL